MKKIDFLYASDDNFAKVLGVSLYSLLIHNKNNINRIFIISQNIKKENKKNIIEIGKKFSLDKDIIFIEMPDIDRLLGEKVDIKRYSASMFSRIMIDSLLPKDVTRLIYLDCDTMIKGDLNELWSFNLQNKPIGAVNDYRSIYYQRNLGIKDENCYVNSGVLLLDLEKYRQNKLEKRLLDALKRHNGSLEFPDNDIICKIAQDEIELLPLKYNVTSIFYMTNYKELMTLRKPHKKEEKEKLEDAKSNPSIVHFTTCFLMKGRPWLFGCDHPLVEEYLDFYKKTPWKNTKLDSETLNRKKKFRYFVSRNIPRFCLIKMCGIIHAYIKPLLQRKKLRKVRED